MTPSTAAVTLLNEHSFSIMSRALASKKNADKHEQILEAAATVFAHKGYYGARVADIAARAGIADGTIYLYFRSKEDILVKLFDEVISKVLP